MPSEQIEKWFKSKRYAKIESQYLRPRPHPKSQELPLSVSRGQAETVFLEDKKERKWILKIFFNNRCPKTFYLKRISQLLPRNHAFRCGTERKILSRLSLQKDYSSYYSTMLAGELKNCVLMPHIDGLDWSTMAEKLRSNQIQLDYEQRRQLCKNLAATVRLLERNSISHRDLSNGNIFIDPVSLDVSLIDFDSMYHPSLNRPSFTTVGSEGYTAPFVNPSKMRSSYCQFADRYALAILCAEFLITCPQSNYCHEGGIFLQEDLNNRNGKTVSNAYTQLARLCPEALTLFNAAINSRSFSVCPAPDRWFRLFRGKNRPENPIIKIIHRTTLKQTNITQVIPVIMPDDPWKTKGELNHGNNLQSNSGNNPSAVGSNGHADNNQHTEILLREMEKPLFKTNLRVLRTADGLYLESLQNPDFQHYAKILSR